MVLSPPRLLQQPPNLSFPFQPSALWELQPGWYFYSVGQLRALLCSTPHMGPYSLRVSIMTTRPYFFGARLPMTSLASWHHSPPVHCSSYTGLLLFPEPTACSHLRQHLSTAFPAAWTICLLLLCSLRGFP